MKTVRIGCGQGFWGDSQEAPLQLLEKGDLDYLVLDFLAEVTMSILSKQHQRDSSQGYARDIVSYVERGLPALLKRGTKIITNAGGINPRSCALAIKEVLRKHGKEDSLKIAIVEGDNLLGSLESLHQGGEAFEHLETGDPFSKISKSVLSANAYLGTESVVSALAQGAHIVICGRVADPSLVLSALRYEFSWAEDDWDRLSAGIVAGHIIECGAQCTGGNLSWGWQALPDMADIGYPIVEVSSDGTFFVTKPVGTGGKVSAQTVKEQLVYEIADPTAYFTPDAIADFTSLRLEDLTGDRVKISQVKGRARPDKLKVSISYQQGYSAFGTLLYTWPNAYQKARFAGELVEKRLRSLGIFPHRFLVECIGAGACHGDSVPQQVREAAEEVMLRIAVQDENRKIVERFTREMAPLVLNGPPGATAYSGGKRQVQEVYAYWPTLVGRDRISTNSECI